MRFFEDMERSLTLEKNKYEEEYEKLYRTEYIVSNMQNAFRDINIRRLPVEKVAEKYGISCSLLLEWLETENMIKNIMRFKDNRTIMWYMAQKYITNVEMRTEAATLMLAAIKVLESGDMPAKRIAEVFGVPIDLLLAKQVD